ncbi:acyclic terpene utilization AtuA family protein [Clostridium sp. JS66]|uniref:acyclic terpene utilization AtuA family protein n=1 Tax=Clostridium sp. JS66 TaxID=3064705 RepID=UPI00298E1AF0|nr:acyclic terpene utilization AtuA family protein [Clostridium sp. JS66]WPC41249.1 acyclic terpene utilization AtuA family protein [Clostridium sp. JS66]
MSICKVFVPYGSVGFGISQEDFDAAMALKPDIISSDAGSTDSGPYYLGNGKCKYSRESVKADIRMMIVAAHKSGIPITIGSSGTCGVDDSVDWVSEICCEICNEEGINAKIAKIYTEQCGNEMKKRYTEGKIKPLEAAPSIQESTFDECSHIVALAGIEPFIKALKEGADIVICGRATDTAVIAAMPILKGCGAAVAWHGAKVTECGCICTTNPLTGGVFLTVEDDSFIVEAVSKTSSCTPYSISAHLLYENSDPFHLTEPGVVIDTTNCTYEQLENGRVKVTGTKISYSKQYTMKLEGAGPAGFQTVTLVGVRDKRIMKDPEKWISNMEAFVADRLNKLGFNSEDYSYNLRAYGWNAVYGGPVPSDYVPNELGILLTVTAQTQELATKVAKVFNPWLLHFPVDKKSQLPSFAFPFSPAEIEKGPIFEFKLDHVVEVNDPLELIRMKFIECSKKIGGK